MSSAMRASIRAGTPSRASPTATFAGLPPGRASKYSGTGAGHEIDQRLARDGDDALTASRCTDDRSPRRDGPRAPVGPIVSGRDAGRQSGPPA